MKKVSTKTTILWLVIGALLIAILWLLWTEPEPPRTQIQVRTEENTQTKARIAEREAVIKRLKQEAVDDSISALRAANGFKMQIARLREKLRQNDLSKASAPELDSIVTRHYAAPAEPSYCMPLASARAVIQDALASGIKDSIIAAGDARRVELEADNKQDSIRYRSIIWNLESNNRDQERISSNLTQDVNELQAENKSLRKKEKSKKLLKWGERTFIGLASFFLGRGIR